MDREEDFSVIDVFAIPFLLPNLLYVGIFEFLLPCCCLLFLGCLN